MTHDKAIDEPSVEVRLIRQQDPSFRSQLQDLYRHTGWLEAHDESNDNWISFLVSGSFCCFGAFHEERLVGFGRAISDGVSDAYIQDVMVADAYRGLNVGSRIVRALLDELQQHEIKWIGLIAAPGTAPFYRRLGFLTLTGHVPMRYQEKENHAG